MPTPRRPHPRLATTLLTEPVAPALPRLKKQPQERAAPAPREPFFRRPPEHWRPWFWLAALLLHMIVIATLLLLLRKPRMEQAFEPTGVQVVYDAGSPTPQTPRQTPIATPSHAPPPAQAAPPPPPPAEAAENQPEVNLNLPTQPFADLPVPMPQPMPETQSAASSSHTPHSARHTYTTHAPRYLVMNNMSLNAPSAQNKFANRDLNLDAGGANSLVANSPEISIEGHVGSNWEAAFNKWVNEHIYYPQAAAEQGQQGASTIRFTVHRDGSVSSVQLLQSAGSTFLDQAWMGIFLQNNVPPFPPGSDDTIKITATLDYRLRIVGAQ